MSLINTSYIKKKTDKFFTSHISKFHPNDSKINKQAPVEDVEGKLTSFYRTREKCTLQKIDFEINLYDFEKVRSQMNGSSSEKLFSKAMISDLIELHNLLRNHFEEEDKVADDIYVMF